MIDWLNLVENILWILGCALALATFSYASWQASTSQRKLRAQLAESGVQQAFNLAGVLFCAGLATTSRRPLEMILWSVLGVLFLVQIALVFRQKAAGPAD